MESPRAVMVHPPAVSQFVPLTALSESPTNPRKHFEKGALEELAAAIKDHGVLQPILVRPHPNSSHDSFEIVAGARRYRASKITGLAEVPVLVRDLSDEEVALIQLIENGQRADLSPIEEAEAFAALAAKGLSVAMIAERLRKERSRVAKYLRLATLAGKVKESLASGLLSVEHAQAIARIPDAKLQEAALSRILEDFGSEKPILGAVPLAVAKKIIEEEFMTDLSLAVFDPADPSLSPLGECAKCPFLTGNDRDLFGDIKGRSICTNPKDFRLKTENHLKSLKESGHVVLITAKEQLRAYPSPHDRHRLSKDYVDLEAVCPDDPKRRSYEVLLGKAAKLATVYVLRESRVRRLYPSRDLRSSLLAAGHAFAKKPIPRTPKQKAADAGPVLIARRIQDAVAGELATKLRATTLEESRWWDLFARVVVAVSWNLEPVFRRHGYDGSSEAFALKREHVIAELIAKMGTAEKRALALDFLVEGWGHDNVDKERQKLYAEILKLAGVDKTAIAKRVVDASKNAKAAAKERSSEPTLRSASTARASTGKIAKSKS